MPQGDEQLSAAAQRGVPNDVKSWEEMTQEGFTNCID
jgi:hypothetical protein